MAKSSKMIVALVLIAVSWCMLSLVEAAKINIINQCSQDITACATDNEVGASVNCYALGAGSGFQQMDVGSNWPGGLIWGYPGNNNNPSVGITAKPQANLAEITIGGANNLDYYDISNVNAYNLPMRVSPTSGGQLDGFYCGSPTCVISNLKNGFCTSPNTLSGVVGDGCYNLDGPYTSGPTSGTIAFKNACPNAFSYSTDGDNVDYTCNTGSDYKVVFCP